MADLNIAVRIAAETAGAVTGIGGVTKVLGGLGPAASASMGALGSLTKGLGTLGLAASGLQALGGAAKGLASSFGVGLASEAEQVAAKFNAFTKDAGKTAEIMALVRSESDKTPFSFAAMSNATAGLMPVAKASGAALMDLVKQAEVLAASNPAEGLEGAAFALREAVSGDFTSVIERFNLPRSMINQLKAEGVPALEIVSRSMKSMGYDMDLVANMAATGAGKWNTFQDAIDGIRMKAAEPIFAALKNQLDMLGDTLGDNKGFLESIATTIGTTIAGAIGAAGSAFQIILPILKTFGQYLSAVSQGGDALNDYLLDLPRAIEPLAVYFGTITRIVQAVGRVFTGDFLGALEQVQTAVADAKFYIAWKLQEWGEAFLGWIGPMIPGLLAQLGGLAKSILDWFIESRLQQAEQLTGWATTFLDWIGPMIPPFLVELGKLGASMLTWLEEKVPEVVDRIVVWATTLTDWIAPRIPVLLEEAGKLGASMLDWLQEKVPEIVQKLTIWAAAITDWIAPRIPVLLEEGGKLLTGLLTWVTEKGVPLAKQFVTEWVPAMINWVLQAETDLVPKVGAFITGLLAWVTEKGPPLAYTFLSEWVPAAIGWVAEAAIKILPNLAMLLGTIALWVVSDGIPAIWTLFVSLGGAIVKGVLDGIGNLKDQLANAIGDAVGGAIEEGKRRMSEWRPSLPEIKMPVLGRGGGGMGGLPVPAISPGGWNSPVPGAAISQEYGRTPYSGIYPGGIHTGIDLAAALGRNVFAASSGTVARAGWDSSGYGNMVVIAHGNGLSTLYGHLNKIDVSAGQQVASGQDIGDLGSTGNSSGPHVHFELLRNGSHFNPRSLIPAFAAGVRDFAGGLALVGEKGPEVTYLPPGSDVYSNQDSRRMLGGGQPITVNVHVAGSVQSEQDLVRGIYNGLRELERSGLRLGTN